MDMLKQNADKVRIAGRHWFLGGIYDDKGNLLDKIYYKFNDKGQLVDHKFITVTER